MSEYKTNAPIYAAELLNLPVKNSKNKTKEHLLIAGGGGKSATGVLNELQLFELTALNAANISQLTTSSPSPIKKILEVSTDISKIPKDLKNTEEKLEFLNNAPMNLSVKNDKLIAVGVGEKVQIYEVFSEQNKQDKEDDGISTVASGRIRKRNVGNSGQENINSRSESSIKLNKISEITDTSLNPDEAPVTRLSFHQNSNFLTTGGSNTDLKFFQYHKLENLEKLSLELKYEILKSHSKELKDISVCKNLVASISDDKNCFVWKVGSDSFEKIWSLREQFYFYFKIKSAYKFMAVKLFQPQNNNPSVPSQIYLLTCHSPILSRTTDPSYLCFWRYNENKDEKFELLTFKNLYDEVGVNKVASKALYLDNVRRICGVGFTSGHVVVYSLPDFEPIFRHEPENLRQATSITNVIISKQYVITTSLDMCIRTYLFKNNYSNFWKHNGKFVVCVLLILLLVILRVVSLEGIL